jgi:ABC-type Fe3+-hydroxamate transport system substrate-binding protein
VWWLVALTLGCGPTENAPSGPDATPARRRILSLSPSVSRLLVELGAGFEIVAADSASRALPGVGSVADLGALELSAVGDALASGPDLVVGLATPRARDFAAALEARGLVVHLFDPQNADAAIAVTYRLGDLLERPTRAISVAAAHTRSITELAVGRDGLPRLTVAWLVGCDPLTAVGGSGLTHEVLELAGAENSFHQLGVAQVQITREQLKAGAPAVILDSTGHERSSRCFDLPLPAPRIVPTPIALASLPALDVYQRIRAIQAILYPSESQAPTADPVPGG